MDGPGPGGFAWVDGSPLGYTNWNPAAGMPPGQMCVMMGTDGTWWYHDCGLDPLPYVCECGDSLDP